MTLSVPPAKTTRREHQRGCQAGGQRAGDDAGHRPGRLGADGCGGVGQAGGGVGVDAHDGLALAVGGFCSRAWTRTGLLTPVRWPGSDRLVAEPRSSWASSPREVTPALANTLRRWNATVRGETQIWAATSLLDSPEADQLGDLELHRGQLHQRGDVALAGSLAGGAQLLGRAVGERFGVQVAEGLQGAPQVLAGVDATLGAAQPLAVGEVDAGLVQPATGALVVGQRVLRTAPRRLAGVASRHGAPVGDRGQRPRPAGGLGELGELVDPRAGQVGFAGSDGCVDALDGGHPGQDRAAGTGARWWRAPKVSPVAAARMPLGPPGQVVHGVGQDAQRVRRDDLVEVGAGRSS